jgi:hypothetical protein
MTSDEFIASAWRKPPPAFARELRERLRTLDTRRGPAVFRTTGLRAAACAAALLAGAGLLSFPAVRAGARVFLDLFRVTSFAGVPVQRQHMQALLSRQGIDLPALLGEQLQVQKAAGPPQQVATLAEAAKRADIPLRLPTWQPVGLGVQHIEVQGDQRLSVTLSADKLRRVLESQGIDDLPLPDGIDGQVVRMYVPPVVRITYGGAAGQAVLVEARHPEAAMPAGLDVARIAEIGLRVLGLDREQAYRYAQSIDWRTTLMVPVPVDVASFREVDVQGRTGLLIEAGGPARGGAAHPGSVLLWSSGDQVLALIGNLGSNDLIEMAQSAQ